MKIRTEKIIDVSEWNALVEQVYKRPYNFQQQDGCKERGLEYFTVPVEFDDSYLPETVPEKVNYPDMCVRFSAWLTRSPTKPITEAEEQKSAGSKGWLTRLWWERNFYPNIQMVANDLHAKGFLEAGKYAIDIDW